MGGGQRVRDSPIMGILHLQVEIIPINVKKQTKKTIPKIKQQPTGCEPSLTLLSLFGDFVTEAAGLTDSEKPEE